MSLKSYRVKLRNGKSSLTTSVSAAGPISAAFEASRLFPGWSCTASDAEEEPQFDECVASGQGHSYGPCGPCGETQCRYCGVAPSLDAKSTAHVDKSGATVTTPNGAVYHFTSGDADPLRSASEGNRRWWPIEAPNCRCVVEPSTYTLSRASYRKAMAAVATCEQLGYTHEGGEQWARPLGSKIGRDSKALDELLAVIHGDGGHYQEKHGTKKACNDALAKIADMRRMAEERVKTLTVDIKVDATHVAAAMDKWIADHEAKQRAGNVGNMPYGY